jgi:tetratricopeptide (TPR) repeat protein
MAVHNIRPIQCDDLSTTPFCMSPEFNYEDVILIWTDENVNANFDCLDTKCRLTTIVNYLKVFSDVEETINYVRLALNEHLFLIVSGSLGEMVISQIYKESQLKFIYVFCIDKEKHLEWTYKYEKICGIFTDKYELFHHLSTKVRAYEKSLMDISIFSRTCPTTEENSIRDYFIEENISLMWLQLFFDILLRMPLDKNVAKQDMIAECRLYYKNNSVELKRIDEFEIDYCPETVIHWYTRDSFVYRLLNKALRTLNIDIIFKFRFLIIDLYQQLKQRHIDYIESLPTINPNKIIHTVYRSQHLGINELEKLKAGVGSLICPNSFFSTTESFLMAKAFVAGGRGSECVLFQIDIPDSYYSSIADALQYTRPFLKLESLSQFESESEVIFALGALFRIESIEEYDMWYVCLKFEAEHDELGEDFHLSEELENINQDWQNRRNVEDRILLLTEKLPQSCRGILNVYIKYGIFADENNITTAETLTTYRKGFELITKCLPDYCYLITVAMQLSIGLLYCNRGERILTIQLGEAAVRIAENYLHVDRDCLLICYDYLAVIHQLEDQYTEALSIYEKMLSLAIEQDHTSALLAIYDRIQSIAGDSGDYEYELICLKKVTELSRKLGCEDKVMTYFNFAVFYERKQNFDAALYYYKKNFLCLLQRNTSKSDLTRAYYHIGKMYEKQNYYIAALQIYVQMLAVELVSLPCYDRLLLWRYETMIKCIQRLIKCKCLKNVRYSFQSLMSKSPSSITFIKFIKKIKFLFYFKLDHPIALKESLNVLLTQILTEYNNRMMYGTYLKNLQRLIERFMKMKPPCFAKIYHNAQMLRKLRATVDGYQQFLYLIQRAYFSSSYMDKTEAQANYLSIKTCSNDIGRVIHSFNHSSHATLCQDRAQQKPRRRHRSTWICQYRFCGCFKNSSALHNRFTGSWARFCKI